MVQSLIKVVLVIIQLQYRTVSAQALQISCFATRHFSTISEHAPSWKSSESLTLTNCDETTLRNITGHLKSVKRLFIDGNNLKDLNLDVFTGTTNLETLSLQRNSLSRVPSGVFSSLAQLKRLYLSHNELQQLEDGAFEGLRNVVYLDLSFNRLRKLDGIPFIHTKNLRELSVSDNNISDIDCDFYKRTKSVEILNLSSNSLWYLKECMRGNLHTVDLSKNYFRYVPDFVGIVVKQVNMSHNRIESVNVSVRL